MLSNYKLGNLISIDIEFPAILCHFVFVFLCFFLLQSSWIRNRNFQYLTETNQYRMNKVFSTLFVFYFSFNHYLSHSGCGFISNFHFKSLEPQHNSSAIIGLLKMDSSCFFVFISNFHRMTCKQPFTSKWKNKFIWFCNQSIWNERKIEPEPNNQYLCFASEFIHQN